MKSLVLSGGGGKGSYELGVLRYLLNDLQINYSGFCGISVGSLNSAFLAQFKSGEEKQAYAALDSLWKNVNTGKIYKRWFPFGRISALWKSSVYNSAPLLNWISEMDLDKIRSSGKEVRVGAVSLTSGEYRAFDQNYSDFKKAVAASSSYPVFLNPIEMEGELWSDGGIKNITPLKTAIKMGATEIDVIITSPISDTKPFPSKPNSIDVLMRTLDLMSDEIIANDIEDVEYYNNLVLTGQDKDKRFIKINVIRPNKNLTDNSLDFTPSKLEEMAAIGYEDAKNQYKL